ncbi:MAG: hypothetical protein ACYS8W_14395 [Planctomycetota bacterium]|jgi:hypothetical protein
MTQEPPKRDYYYNEPEYIRPGWVTALAIAGLIIGGLGVMASAGQMVTPKILEFQKAIWKAMEESFEKAEQERKKRMEEAAAKGSPQFPAAYNYPPPAKEFFGVFEKFTDMPQWFKTALVVFGVIGLFVCGLYIVASIKLFSATPESVRLFIIVMALGTVLALVEVTFSMFSDCFVGFIILANIFVGAVASFILLIIAASADKSALRRPGETL